MRRIFQSFIALVFTTSILSAQSPIEFSFSNTVKFLKSNSTDTLLFPFVGGLNAPQFNNIDLDRDGKKDLFVFDRAGHKHFTFLWKNNRWEYAPQFEQMFPRMYNWVFLRDYNCDGELDIFSEVDQQSKPEPDKFIYNQGIRVLKNEFLTNGKLSFRQNQNQIWDTGYLINPPSPINYTSSDLGVIEDLDNDGDIDILRIPSGDNTVDLFENVRNLKGYSCDSLTYFLRAQGWGYMYYKIVKHEWGLADLRAGLIKNYLCKGAHGGNTMAVYDMDGDGDKDLLYGDVAYPNLIYLKNGKELCATGCKKDTIIFQDTVFPRGTFVPNDFTWPSAYFFDADADGISDLVIAPNDPVASKNLNQVNLFKNNPVAGVANFSWIKENFLQDEMIDLGGQAKPVFVDIDNDGDEDLITATSGNFLFSMNSKDRLVLYKNINTKSNPVFQLADTNFLNISAGQGSGFFDIHPSFGDLTGDGKKDLLIGDFNGYIHFYENTSVGNTISFSKQSDDYFSIFCGVNAKPQIIDLNKDGKSDLVIGRKNGTLAYYENNGTTSNANFTSAPTIDSLGGVDVSEVFFSGGQYIPGGNGYSSPFIYDINNDGNYEMLVGSNNTGIHFYLGVNPIKGQKFSLHRKVLKDNLTLDADSINQGYFTNIALANLDSDSIPDLMIGNSRGGLRFYKTAITGSLDGLPHVVAPKINFTVYPNPAENILNISLENLNESVNFSIINILGVELTSGKLKKSERNSRLNISEFPQGIYFIKIFNDFGITTSKSFIISR